MERDLCNTNRVSVNQKQNRILPRDRDSKGCVTETGCIHASLFTTYVYFIHISIHIYIYIIIHAFDRIKYIYIYTHIYIYSTITRRGLLTCFDRFKNCLAIQRREECYAELFDDFTNLNATRRSVSSTIKWTKEIRKKIIRMWNSKWRKKKKVSVSEREKISIDRTIDSFLVEEYVIRFHYRDATFPIIR